MKNNFMRVIITLIVAQLAISIVLVSFSGCVVQAYAAEIYEPDLEINEYTVNEYPKTSVFAFGQEYNIKFASYKLSNFTNERIEKYHVADEERGTISFDENGDIVELSFFGHLPSYIFELSTTEAIRIAVEAELSELTDFSIYNDFSLETWKNDGTLDMKWQVIRELPCNIAVHLVVNPDGEIITYLKTKACPDHLSKRFVSDEVRDDLILKEIQNKHTGSVIESFSIESEVLSLYKGKDALLYTVQSVDKDGWSFLDVIVIH